MLAMLLALACLLSAWALASLLQSGGWGRALVAALAFALAAVSCRHCWRDWPRGVLAWDGQGWHLASPWLQALPVQLAVGWDGGSWLWLKACADPRSGLWRLAGRRAFHLLLMERDSPALWGDLRRAVYFSAVPQAS